MQPAGADREERPPPTFSGLPAGDRSGWDEFRAAFEKTHRPMWEEFDAWSQEQGAPALPDLEFVHTSRDLNLYLYPEVLDYAGVRPLDASWHRLDSCVRETDSDVDLPSWLVDRPPGSALVYLSLGSLGSADVGLMRRLVEVLGRTPHRFIVSKGPQHAEFDLAENMWGAEFLPQTRIIPRVDLVVTHGGNNTVTESVHFGKPMVVLPLFWDQYDNAQRVHELGLGIRLTTYAFDEEQMHATLERLLGDSALHGRLKRASRTVRDRDGLSLAADLIERTGSGQDW